MKFNSVKSGNFSGMAGHVNKVMDQAFAAGRSTAVDHSAIAAESIKGRSLERRAAMKAEGKVAQAGLKAFSKVKDTKNQIESKEKINDILRPAKRMAGIVGGLGAITSGAVMMKQNAEDKADREALKNERDKLNSMTVSDYEQAKKERAELLDWVRGGRKGPLPGADSLRQGGSSLTSVPKSSAPASTGVGATNALTSGTPKAKGGKSNWGALSSIIRKVEGTTGDKGYRTRFGGYQFDDMSKHPNIKAPTPWGTSSEAAGAYQFMKPTWDEAKSALGLTDFSSASQEKAGRFLTNRRGVNPDQRFTTYEGFSSAISKLSPEWAGLPNSQKGRTGYHGQANASMQDLWTQYQNYFN